MELTAMTAAELARVIRSGEASALEVVDAHLARIERVNPAVNAIAVLDADGARAQARAADQARARGDALGPLHGVPCTLKLHLEAAGLLAFDGFSEHVPARDGAVAERLRAAGAILLGKTNMAMSVQTVNARFGRTVNPYDRERGVGGSSGGAAAAVAARLVPFDVGTDMSGSVRMPAHFCGVFGLKPTQHRVSTVGMMMGPPGTPRLDRDFGVSGPLARTVEDLALVLGVIAGPRADDPEVPPVPLGPVPRRAARDLRIAIAPSIHGIACSDEVRGAIVAAGRALAGAGAKVEEAEPFAFEELLAAFRRMLPITFAAMIDIGMAPPGTPPPANAGIIDLMRALDERDRFAAALDGFLARFDAFLCPPTICSAIPHAPPGQVFEIDVDGEKVSSRCVDHPCLTASYTGVPAVVVPVALGAGGLPIGAQLLARRWHDDRLLGVAALLAEAVGPLPAPAL